MRGGTSGSGRADMTRAGKDADDGRVRLRVRVIPSVERRRKKKRDLLLLDRAVALRLLDRRRFRPRVRPAAMKLGARRRLDDAEFPPDEPVVVELFGTSRVDRTSMLVHGESHCRASERSTLTVSSASRRSHVAELVLRQRRCGRAGVARDRSLASSRDGRRWRAPRRAGARAKEVGEIAASCGGSRREGGGIQ